MAPGTHGPWRDRLLPGPRLLFVYSQGNRLQGYAPQVIYRILPPAANPLSNRWTVTKIAMNGDAVQNNRPARTVQAHPVDTAVAVLRDLQRPRSQWARLPLQAGRALAAASQRFAVPEADQKEALGAVGTARDPQARSMPRSRLHAHENLGYQIDERSASRLGHRSHCQGHERRRGERAQEPRDQIPKGRLRTLVRE